MVTVRLYFFTAAQIAQVVRWPRTPIPSSKISLTVIYTMNIHRQVALQWRMLGNLGNLGSNKELQPDVT